MANPEHLAILEQGLMEEIALGRLVVAAIALVLAAIGLVVAVGKLWAVVYPLIRQSRDRKTLQESLARGQFPMS